MVQRFEPHPLIRGGQMQTLVAFAWTEASPLPPDEQIIVALQDGDELVIDINHPMHQDSRTPLVYLIHGLGGDASSAYKLRLAQKLTRLGFRVLRHNHRGAGQQAYRARSIYHSGSSLDVLTAIQTVAARWPDSPLLTIGFSLSGTILLNMLGRHYRELHEIPQLRAAMSVCAPIDLELSSLAIDQWRNKHLDSYYVFVLIRQLIERGLIDARTAHQRMGRWTLRAFDEGITAPMGGFHSRSHYYETCSPQNIVADIQCPTTILAAADDPIVPALSVFKAPYSTKTILDLQKSGGHLGFLARRKTPLGDIRWLDAYIARWAMAHSFS